MFKTKVTRTMFKGLSVVRIGYCEAQALLRGVEPKWYGSGVYGWNYDLYNVDGVLISTGYRPIGNIRPDRLDINLFEQAAAALDNDTTKTWQEKEEERALILSDFIEYLKRCIEKGGE